jgi:hypothetical protein
LDYSRFNRNAACSQYATSGNESADRDSLRTDRRGARKTRDSAGF